MYERAGVKMIGYFSQTYLILDDETPIKTEMEVDKDGIKVVFEIKDKDERTPHNSIILSFSHKQWEEFVHKGESLIQDAEIEGLLK